MTTLSHDLPSSPLNLPTGGELGALPPPTILSGSGAPHLELLRGKTALDAGWSIDGSAPDVEGEAPAGTIEPIDAAEGEIDGPPPLPRASTNASGTGHLDSASLAQRSALAAELSVWMKANLQWYAISFAAHMIALAVAMLMLGSFYIVRKSYTPELTFSAVDDNWSNHETLAADNIAPPQIETTLLSPDTIRDFRPLSGQPKATGDAQNAHPAGGGLPGRESLGGGDAFAFSGAGAGPKHNGAGGLGADRGFSTKPGRGGAGEGYGDRGGARHGPGSGRTKDTDLAVAIALDWFHRHRNQNGSWSLVRFTSHCKGNPCSSPGTAEADAAATALALLPMLGAGETHLTRGPYRDDVKNGLYWLIHHQTTSGDLSAGSDKPMYAHALATLALCEAYGMTQDIKLREAAQRGVFYIEAAQVRATGGWRYVPADVTGGDTSVLGWQMMALRGAQLAGINVNTMTMENAKKWLARVSKGSQHGLYAYQPLKEATPTMTAIGMLSWQYMGMRADDPTMVEGKYYLMDNLPDNGVRNTYYWYYATQVMHNFGSDPKWDTWNRRVRRCLVETQCREGCAAGSWDPESPTLDAWSEQGGRIVTTAFSTLSLEVYYRYLPIYRMGSTPTDEPPPGANAIGNLNDVVAP